MKNLKKSYVILLIITLITSLFYACTPPNAQTNVINNDQAPTEQVQEPEPEPEPTQPQIQMPAELTKEESDKYKSILTLWERNLLAYELAEKMPSNGMEPMMRMFPDLSKTKETNSNDPQNLLKQNTESWYYSAEADFTIIVFFLSGSPIYIFEGQEPTQEEINEASTIINTRIQEFYNEPVEQVQEPEAIVENEPVIEADVETAPEGDFEEITPYDQEDPQFVDYTDEMYMKLIANKPLVIFFYAPWCGTCLRLETDINNEIGTFPKGTKILKADFDKVKHLREDYSIILQSTFVVIDKDGNVITKLSVPTNQQLIDAIKTSL
ncbi:thioredoxin domain-containing protein [Patescibacteria group bacterium]